MRLRSSGCLRWSYLPQEVRRNILHAIVDQRNPRWSALASVSKEWQSVIGMRNMAKLNLRSSCLEDFEKAVVRQRDLVRHIYLNVELPEYKCRLCKREFDITTSEKNERLMANATQRLLVILSTWHTTAPLTLELNASSPSDSKHWFKNFRFNDEHDAHYTRDQVIPMGATHSDCHDPKHGWENGVQAKPPPFSANERLFGPIDLLHYDPDSDIVNIPKVNAVTRFMIRRQFHHILESTGFEYILSRFSRLADFVYEPWPQEYISIFHGPWEPLISTRTPETLKRLTIFQDSKHYLTKSAPQKPDLSIIPPQYTSLLKPADNTTSIAQTSLRLNELYVSFFIDAMNFFEACEEEWTWDHLKSLSLTSSRLFQSIKGQKHRIDDLLIAAAKLVLRMPNLTTMVLWNGGTGRACAFMYTRTEHYAHITWRGTWDLEISRQVLEAWEDVAKLHSVKLKVRHERLHETIRSHGDAIFHLNLPCQVIEPTSLWQIRMEDAQGL
ncbi:uncharacterized protein FSUBG_4914 [Fusarium subglutinans]|uniref:DUF6546 domain-containing protein n=1 Tax=Gibberella subglutinans TaxID=42677 RepID=A0A8H5V432_GIBSU|nr:uncharacterized protein FSUBG_4914 [Fusarium subglutinans]KAF5608090.1 hypothetical protein FSUBG_4914 [Fusarium subglutinans]